MKLGARFHRQRQPRTRKASAALGPLQIRWLGALLIAVQLPQAADLPLWVAGFGIALVALRLWLLTRDRARPGFGDLAHHRVRIATRSVVMNGDGPTIVGQCGGDRASDALGRAGHEHRAGTR